MKTYEQWVNRLRAWADSQANLQSACLHLSRELHRRGHSVSEWTLRRHIEGVYLDVKLGLATAVDSYLDELED